MHVNFDPSSILRPNAHAGSGRRVGITARPLDPVRRRARRYTGFGRGRRRRPVRSGDVARRTRARSLGETRKGPTLQCCPCPFILTGGHGSIRWQYALLFGSILSVHLDRWARYAPVPSGLRTYGPASRNRTCRLGRRRDSQREGRRSRRTKPEAGPRPSGRTPRKPAPDGVEDRKGPLSP